MNSKLIDIHEWCAYSRLWTGQGNNGLSSLIGDDTVTVEHCLIATLSIHFDLN